MSSIEQHSHPRMIWSKSGTFRPGDPRAASQPRIAAGCVAGLPRQSRRPRRNPPLMLLHGLGMTADLNWGAAYAELCQGFRVVAPDLPGHGRGIRPWPKFSLEKCADHMVALADWLGIDKFIACGYSMGSLVAQLIWRRHPDRVSGLVLGATSRNFLGSPPSAWFHRSHRHSPSPPNPTLFCAHSTPMLSAPAT